MPDGLPALGTLVAAADAALHPWVRAHVAEPVRRAALEDGLDFWLTTAAQDLDYARGYAAVAPESGEPPASYLDRWLPLATGGHVLAGPRYLGRDPDLPFVGVSAADRVLVPDDREALGALAREHFAPFAPGFVMLTTADPAGAWPDATSELRQVVGLLGELRRRAQAPAELGVAACTDVSCYDAYAAIHAADVARDPDQARRVRVESRADLQELAVQGLVFDVVVDGEWAGIVAAEPGTKGGVRGAVVIELLLDHRYRGRGYGAHLSTLLARSLPMPDDECLIGSIHHQNLPALRSALAAGRIDVGGEVAIPL